jgi:hypothetical protein
MESLGRPQAQSGVLVELRLYPAGALAKKAPLVAFDVDLDPVLANEAASPEHAVWQQVIGQALGSTIAA